MWLVKSETHALGWGGEEQSDTKTENTPFLFADSFCCSNSVAPYKRENKKKKKSQ